jgi:hypothetical protein
MQLLRNFSAEKGYGNLMLSDSLSLPQRTFSQIDYLYVKIVLLHTLYQVSGENQVFGE